MLTCHPDCFCDIVSIYLLYIFSLYPSGYTLTTFCDTSFGIYLSASDISDISDKPAAHRQFRGTLPLCSSAFLLVSFSLRHFLTFIDTAALRHFPTLLTRQFWTLTLSQWHQYDVKDSATPYGRPARKASRLWHHRVLLHPRRPGVGS